MNDKTEHPRAEFKCPLAETWEHLERLLFKEAWDKDLWRIRTRRAFRGIEKSSYRLETKLERMVAKPAERAKRERAMFRQFRKYAHRDLSETGNAWHWLSIAQHHGLPTRLLDWTNSPLVALHFATKNLDIKEEAAVWSVDFKAINESLPESLFPRSERQGRVFTVDELPFEDLADLEKKGRKECHKDAFMVFFEPPSIDQRIVNQYALFSMLSDVKREPQEWLQTHAAKHCKKIRIPMDLKREIRDRLDMMNITERVLTPGLDGLAEWLQRYYGDHQWTKDRRKAWISAARNW